MKKRIAWFGDVHGALDSLLELYSMLCWESLDEIWHLGDLIDRGPDSEGVVSFCREFGIKGIIGNHEGAMLEKFIKNKTPPKKNPDKIRTYHQLMRDQRNEEYRLFVVSAKIACGPREQFAICTRGNLPVAPLLPPRRIKRGAFCLPCRYV